MNTFIIQWLIGGGISAYIGHRRGRLQLGVILGILLPGLAALVMLLVPTRRPAIETKAWEQAPRRSATRPGTPVPLEAPPAGQ